MERTARLLVLSFFLIAASLAQAATLVVTSTSDSGPGTLRDQVAAAAFGDRIEFDASLDGTNIVLSTPVVVLGKSLEIVGNGPSKTLIQGAQGSFQLFNFFPSVSYNLTLSGMRLSGALSAPAISVTDYELVMDNMLFAGNSTLSPGSAAAISANTRWDVRASYCAFENNFGLKAIIDITGIIGGAATFEGCTFSNNQTVPVGGVEAVVVVTGPKIPTFELCTISGNVSAGIWSSNGCVIQESTLAFNTKEAAIIAGGSFLFVTNTIASDNGGSSGSDIDVSSFAGISTYTSSLVERPGGVNAQLKPLTAKASPIASRNYFLKTHDFEICSPALGGGTTTATSGSADQLGRPFIGTRDIGAYESAPSVEGFSATNSTSANVNLQWDPCAGGASPNVDGYRIYRDGVEIAVINSPATTTFVDADAQEGFQPYEIYTITSGVFGDTVSTLGRARPEAAISGTVDNESGSPVQGVEVCAFFEDTVNKRGGFEGDGANFVFMPDLDASITSGSMMIWAYNDNWASSGPGSYLFANATNAFGVSHEGIPGTERLTLRYFSFFDIALDTTLDAGWHHIGLTWGPAGGGMTAYKVWLDGVEVIGHLSSSFPPTVNGFRLGSPIPASGALPWAGSLDEFQLYDVVKDSTFFSQQINQIPDPTDPSLLANLRFEALPTLRGVGGLAPIPNYAASSASEFVLVPSSLIVPDAGYNIGYCDQTDVSGNYAADRLDLQGLSYVVSPTTVNRFYDPAFRLATATANTAVNFTDTTSFVVRGSVDLSGSTCAQDSVRIVVTPSASLPFNVTYTDEDGNWSFALPFEGNWTFTPTPEGKYSGHGFLPAAQTVMVENDLVGVDFTDTTTSLLDATFRGSCELALDPGGQPIYNIFTDSVRFRSWSTDAGGVCFSESFSTNESNRWRTRLPAAPMTLEVEDVYNGPAPAHIDEGIILARLSTLGLDAGRAINLETTFDTSTQFLWSPAPSLEVADFGDMRPIEISPGTIDTFFSLTQTSLYGVDINVNNNYPYPGNNQSCPIRRSFQLDYIDNLGGRDAALAVNDSLYNNDSLVLVVNSDSAVFSIGQGKVTYLLLAKNVNIAENTVLPGPDSLDYALPFTLELSMPGEILVSDERRLVVEGIQASELNSFAKTPSLPTAVLRDPPGGSSFSTYAEGSENCFEYSLSSQKSSTDEVFGGTKIGFSGSVDFLVVSANIEVYGQVGGGHSWGTTNITQETKKGCTIFNSELRTSDDESFVGPMADIFLGAAFVLRYGLVDEVFYDTSALRFDTRRTILMAEDSTESTFILTRGQILNQQIPALQAAFDLIPKRPDTLNPGTPMEEIVLVPTDSALELLNQIDVWYQTLALTDSIGDQALNTPAGNILYGGGTSFTKELVQTASATSSIAFDLQLDSEIAVEAGFDIFGSGAFFGYRHKWNFGETRDTTQTIDSTLANSATFADLSPDDLFDVTYAWDPVFKSPVFRLNAGQSSCPNEPGTVPRDTALLTISPPSKFVPAPATSTDFTVNISNIAQILSDPEREYCIRVLDNLDNLDVTALGGPLNVSQCQFVDSLSTLSLTMTATKMSSVNDYNDLRLILTAGCYAGASVNDLQILAEQKFSVEFEAVCPDVIMVSPTNGWLANGVNSTLEFRLEDYGVDEVNQVVLQYREAGFGVWENIDTVNGAAIDGFEAINAPITRNWSIPGSIGDGAYEVRAKIFCTSGSIVYTDLATGTIARNASQVIATSPPDGGTGTGGFVNATFNNDLFCGLVSDGSVDVVFRDTGMPVVLASIVCSGNTLTFVVDQTITPLCSLENQWLTYTISGMTDVFGNIAQPYSWEVYVDLSPDPMLTFVTTDPSSAGASDGVIDLTVTGGDAPFSAVWTDQGGAVVFSGPLAGSSQTLSSLPAGIYSVELTDDACSVVSDSVTLGAASCSVAQAPQNPTHLTLSNRVQLQWDPVPQSVGCQVRGNRISPPGPSPSRTSIGLEVSSIDVPFARLGPGTTWTYQVRCACSISPLELTGFSELDTFSAPVLRHVEEAPRQKVNLFPNPTESNLTVDIQGFEDEEIWIRVASLDGRVLIQQRLATTHLVDRLMLDVSTLENGMYNCSVVGNDAVITRSFVKQID